MFDYNNRNKTAGYEENPYKGICTSAAIMGIVSFAMMQTLYFITNNPLFSLEHSINIGFTAAAISPLYMFLSVYKEVKRYETYEKAIDNCRYRVAVSILVHRGYLYINNTHLYLVFASKKPNFISSIKISTIEKITLYDNDRVCVRMRNEVSSNPYEIKFRIEGNTAHTVSELNKVLSTVIEDRRLR